MSAGQRLPPFRTVSDLLADGDLSVVGRFRQASNVTLLADVALGDATARCMYKPIAGERPLWDFPDGTLAGREVAAYQVAQALGWDIVPRTIMRDGPHGVGMVQEWIEADGDDAVIVTRADEVPEGFLVVIHGEDAEGAELVVSHRDSDSLRQMAVLDLILNNADRKGGHILPTGDRVLGVDHGICFHEQPKLRTVLWGWGGEPIPEELVTDVRRWSESATAFEDLAGLLTESEIAALRERVDSLLQAPVMPMPHVDRHSIPWPPF